MGVVEGRARRADHALMTAATRFQTPPSKRDASARRHVIDASRDASRASPPAELVRPCDSHSLLCLRLRTPSSPLPHANTYPGRRADRWWIGQFPAYGPFSSRRCRGTPHNTICRGWHGHRDPLARLSKSSMRFCVPKWYLLALLYALLACTGRSATISTRLTAR